MFNLSSILDLSPGGVCGLNPFPNDQSSKSSKLKEFADDNSEFNENGRKSSKWVENEPFLLFPHCFQKTGTADT